MMKDLYSSMLPAYNWDPSASVSHTHHGAVFNLEFSPDGSLLVAACEKKSILVLDPLRGSLVNHLDNAHNDCVNCIKFLDSRMFATCSDDNTVSIWDIRFLKNSIRSLKGHANWVKNIEYAHDVGLLVTSGFDGSIYTWDINRYSEGDVQFKRVFHTDGLMRTKLSPDGSKLILCTTGGYLMVIHDLDLHMLSKDLQAFQPNMYRVMQLSQTPIHLGYSFNHVFTAKRNRVELISDFPVGNQAEVISSLQVHPQGWCVLSRNTSSDENSEWTCVHDIQDFPDLSKETNPSVPFEDNSEIPETEGKEESASVESADSSQGESSSEPSVDSSSGIFTRPVLHIRFNCRHRTPSDRPEAEGSGSGSNSAQQPAGQERRAVDLTFRLPISSFEALEAVAASIAAAQRNSNHGTGQGSSSDNNNSTSNARNDDSRLLIPEIVELMRERTRTNSDADDPRSSGSEQDDDDSDSVHLDLRERPDYFIRHTNAPVMARTLLFLGSNRRSTNATGADNKNKVPKMLFGRPRLTHYIAEPNVGRGFIKELCFSTDGRLVCSPYTNGVRLLAFNSQCSELSDCVPDKPVKLYEVASNVCHPYVVVSTKFSPTHCLLASGCLNGKIWFYHPLFG